MTLVIQFNSRIQMIIQSKWFTKLLSVRGIMLFPFCIVRTKEDKLLVKHEMIHFYQALKTGLWLWYLPYFYYHIRYGYRKNPYELEAWVNQHKPDFKPSLTSHREYVGKERKLIIPKDGKWENRRYTTK